MEPIPLVAPTVPRILFITSNRIGDAVLASGVLDQLVRQYPDARVTVACGALPAPLFADLPGLERLHVMTKRKRGGHWWDLWKACAGTRWTVVADLRGSLFGWTVWSGRRQVVRADKRHEHRVEELARMLRLPSLPDPRLWVSDDRDRRAVALLGGDVPVLAVGPTANWGAKQWPAERFAETVLRLTAPDGILPGARIAVFGAPNERAAAQAVLDAVPNERLLDCIGMPDLLDAFATLRRCRFYLGNDSGLMHMAAAAGTPTLGLFGPSPDWRYGPWGARCAVVRTPESFEQLVYASSFDHRNQDSLMLSLNVDSVIEAADDLWKRVSA